MNAGIVLQAAVEPTGISTAYALVLVGVVATLGFLTWVVRTSPFAWVATAFTVTFVGLWFLGAVSIIYVWLVIIANVLVVATSGAITKANVGGAA